MEEEKQTPSKSHQEAPKTVKSLKGEKANQLSKEQIENLVTNMIKSKYITMVQREDKQGRIVNYYKSLYKTTGEGKHGQVDTKNVGGSGKVLVHHIFWRYLNGYQRIPIDDNMHISHLDAEPEVQNLVLESKDMNESRKYCHMFGWYQKRSNEPTPRCPHWEHPCTGPKFN